MGERWFRTVDEMLQELPGYRGMDIASRGEAPESEAVYTIPQLEQIIRERIATVYHLHPHSGAIRGPADFDINQALLDHYEH